MNETPTIRNSDGEQSAWMEVQDSLNKRIVELSEELKSRDDSIIQYKKEIERISNENDQLMDMREHMVQQMDSLRRESENQNNQILRLSGELSQHMEEKSVLEEEIAKLKDSLRDPTNYYQQELSRVIDEKVASDERLEMMSSELAQLKEVLTKRMSGETGFCC